MRGSVGSVRVTYDGLVLHGSKGYEFTKPWTMIGHYKNNEAMPTWNLEPGQHVVIAQPFAGTDGHSGPGDPLKLTFTVR